LNKNSLDLNESLLQLLMCGICRWEGNLAPVSWFGTCYHEKVSAEVAKDCQNLMVPKNILFFAYCKICDTCVFYWTNSCFTSHDL